MSLLSVTIILVVLAYLFFQAKSDAKTGYVYWLPNNILLTLFLILWIITVFYYLSFNAALSLLLETSALMLVLYLSTRNLPFLGKVMQPADAKAFSIVYFSSGISMSFIVSPLILLSTMFFCHITFIIWHRVVKKI